MRYRLNMLQDVNVWFGDLISDKIHVISWDQGDKFAQKNGIRTVSQM